jgi:hypothetical protein
VHGQRLRIPEHQDNGRYLVGVLPMTIKSISMESSPRVVK